MNTDISKLLHQAKFLISAAQLSQCPDDNGVEVAFVGRSNAGKSSAINVLTRQSKLAKVSKTPGRTRLINYFTLAENTHLVDLPGYGYAKVNKKMRSDWDQMLNDYFSNRQSLKALVLLMDIRHPLTDIDYKMVEWVNTRQIPIHILLTKADKLSFGKAKTTLLAVQRTLAKEFPETAISMQLFSSLKKQGLEGVWEFLSFFVNKQEEATE